jgi:hypothetical protein
VIVAPLSACALPAAADYGHDPKQPVNAGALAPVHLIQRRTYDPSGAGRGGPALLLLVKPGGPCDEPPECLLGDREAAWRHAVAEKIEPALDPPDEGLVGVRR